MSNIPTPHIAAKKDEIAKIVVMAGDPIRVKFIAENFLDNARLVSDVRNIYAYTGSYKGKELTVMAHGMGNPSMGIYSYELFNFYDVYAIIRVGSMGALLPEIKIKDIIVCENVYTDTNYQNFYAENGAGILKADDFLLGVVQRKVKELNYNFCHFGTTLCSDTYYSLNDDLKLAKEKKLLGVEMESAALYMNAKNLNKKAITICTVSNSLVTNFETSSEERALGFSNMIKLALEVAIELN